MENMALWTLAVPSGGKGVTAEVEQHASVLTYVHITNCALPPNPGDGPHTLVISRSGTEIALATLEKGKQLQHPLDFILDATTVFKVVGGKSPIHLVGYQTSSVIEDSEDPDMYGMEDSEDEDEEDDEEAPQAVPLGGKHTMNGKAGAKKAPARMEDDDEDDEGEDDDEDEDFELNDDDEIGEVESDDEGEEGEDDDEGEDDEGEEEEEEAPKPGQKRGHVSTGTPLTPAPKKIQVEQGKGKAAPATAPPKVAAGAKAGQQQQKSGQQQQQKGGQQQQQQQQKGQQTPGGAKPGQQQQGGAQGDGPKSEAEYEAALTAFLKTQPNKSVAIAAVGSKIKKPSANFKITNFIKSKPAKFKLDANGQNVTLIG